MKTFGHKFKHDPRVVEAKKLLTETLEEYRGSIIKADGPKDDCVESYQALLDKIGDLRGRPLYYRYLSSGLGNGALIELEDGSVKYDFITGIGVHYMGHSHLKILEASVDAALEDTTMQGHLQQSGEVVELQKMIKDFACANGAKLEHNFLTSSGAMANENALKVVFQKKSPASRILAFHRCFAGRTMTLAQITDKEENRQGLPKVLNVDYVPFFDEERPEESTQEAVDVLKKHIQMHKNEYAGMIFELIQGEGGYYPGSHDFFVALMDVLKKNNIAVMVDEIQTFGRTTSAFAFQYFGLDEYVDVVTIGKMSQICATLFTEEYNPGPGLLSQTFTSSTSAIFAAKVILGELKEGHYLGPQGKIAKLSKHFTDRLEALSQKYPNAIKGPFGLGAMIGCTITDGSAEKTKEFLAKLYDNGVIAFMAGKELYRVRFLMPVGAVTEKDIDEVAKIIEQTLEGLK